MRSPLALLLLLFTLGHAAHFPPGRIYPILHHQALSHIAFHSNPLKLHLASLTPPRTAVVVGVEWGQEVIAFAAAGYRVHAFEPLSRFVAHLRRLAATNTEWDLRIVPVAAGNSSEGTVGVEYRDEEEVVKAGMVDQYVEEEVGVLSVDVQGGELEVLQGSRKLLDGKVTAVWVEAIACEERVKGVLELLDERYVVFDFVPWGKEIGTGEGVPKNRGSFVYEEGRPEGFQEYLDWMCALRDERFEWLQTDFLAVKRERLTHEFVDNLGRLAEDVCGGEGGTADCLLREMLRKEEENEEKNEL